MNPNVAWLAAELSGSRWRAFEWVASTGSTNADLAAAWRSGAADGRVLVADHQTDGRGRFDRSWTAPPGAMVALSVLVRPQTDELTRWAWLPLVAGLAVAAALRDAVGVAASLKWPNDVLVSSSARAALDDAGNMAGARGGVGVAPHFHDGEKKICGILAERVVGPSGAAIVLGMGVNTAMTPEQAPVERATSLAMVGASSDPRPVVAAVLRQLDAWLDRWESGADLVVPYKQACSTIGREVRVLVGPDGSVEGRAVGVDSDGHLLVDTPDGQRTFAAGDVWHLR